MLIEVARTGDVPEGEVREVRVGDVPIALANLGGGRFLAVGDVCSHERYFLHEGEVDLDEGTIECPKHGSTFDLSSGEALTLPATRPVPTFPVKVEGDAVLIEVED